MAEEVKMSETTEQVVGTILLFLLIWGVYSLGGYFERGNCMDRAHMTSLTYDQAQSICGKK